MNHFISFEAWSNPSFFKNISIEKLIFLISMKNFISDPKSLKTTTTTSFQILDQVKKNSAFSPKIKIFHFFFLKEIFLKNWEKFCNENRFL